MNVIFDMDGLMFDTERVFIDAWDYAGEIYLRACELLEANPIECYALEDSKNGLLSAHRAGCKPIMVPDLWQPDDEILKVIVGVYNDLDEVKAAFEKMQILQLRAKVLQAEQERMDGAETISVPEARKRIRERADVI